MGGGTRVPLVIAGPGLPRGRRVAEAVGLIDLYPTALELAGLPANPTVEGRSLVPLIEPRDDDTDAEPRVAITTYGWGNHAVRDRRYRLIRYEDGSEELYDHDSDPNEWRNLAESAAHEKVLARMRAYLPEVNRGWFKSSKLSTNPYFLANKREHPQAR